MMLKFFVQLGLVLIFLNLNAQAGSVSFQNHQLLVDGQAQPQLFGAELQYFRLRGGQGKNIPRAQVLTVWNRALDKMIEAKMNAISFYIPWDFHEYAEGKFDFTGRVDEDGDGLADYPSRDLVTFLSLIEQKGLKHIMVRPGPYINAEWGFLGFGAIPLWFHEKYPESHMINRDGLRTKLYDYHNPDLLRHTELWFKAVLNIIKPYMGVGRPISFMQIDNETNFMWQSVYDHDFSPSAHARYRKFLRHKYKNLSDLNQAHQRAWKNWNEVQAPKWAWLNRSEDQDWFLFQDHSMYTYLQKIRRLWEKIGVHEPDVLFTLAESYNATENGVLPNYKYRNAQGKTGMMTVNLYPKTFEMPEIPLLNFPFKSDHDVKATDRAKEAYIGKNLEWVLGPEIQGGWWKDIHVSPEARQQTYLTVLGHGMKALFVYYFHEGQNWQTDWGYQQVKPFYDSLKSTSPYVKMTQEELPESFWRELKSLADQKIIAGLDVKRLMGPQTEDPAELYFDAPLDGEAKPRAHFSVLKEIGEKLIAPHQEFLGQATAVVDPVCMLKDIDQHTPSRDGAIDSILMNSEWAGGLLGYLLQAGINPRFIHWGINSDQELDSCQVIFFQDNATSSEKLYQALKAQVAQGKTVVSLLGHTLADYLNLQISFGHSGDRSPVLSYKQSRFTTRWSPLFYYDLSLAPNCQTQFKNQTETVGFKCQSPSWKGSYWQIGTPFYDVFNSNRYSQLSDVKERTSFLKDILAETQIQPRFEFKNGGDRYVVFARESAQIPGFLWLTVKNSKDQDLKEQLLVRHKISDSKKYKVTQLFTGEIQILSGLELKTIGFSIMLKKYVSAVYTVEEFTSN